MGETAHSYTIYMASPEPSHTTHTYNTHTHTTNTPHTTDTHHTHTTHTHHHTHESHTHTLHTPHTHTHTHKVVSPSQYEHNVTHLSSHSSHLTRPELSTHPVEVAFRAFPILHYRTLERSCNCTHKYYGHHIACLLQEQH